MNQWCVFHRIASFYYRRHRPDDKLQKLSKIKWQFGTEKSSFSHSLYENEYFEFDKIDVSPLYALLIRQ